MEELVDLLDRFGSSSVIILIGLMGFTAALYLAKSARVRSELHSGSTVNRKQGEPRILGTPAPYSGMSPTTGLPQGTLVAGARLALAPLQ